MIYIEHDSMDPFFWFALEYYILNNPQLEDAFLFWRTEPTLMLGRYQAAAAEINEAYAREKNIHIIRRLTGGGTIYTDPGSWQFSYIIKNRTDHQIGFKEFIQPIKDALDALGLKTYFSGRNDLMIEDRKFCGNSQYYHQGNILHHGSMLFHTNLDELVKCITVTDDKIVSKGIQSIRQRVANLSDYIGGDMEPLSFKHFILDAILNDSIQRYALTPDDLTKVNQISEDIFKNWKWNYGEAPSFQIIRSRKFTGGRVKVGLNLKQGIIQDCRIYGDFFFSGDMQALTQSLINCPYRIDAIRTILSREIPKHAFYMISMEELIDCII